MPLKKCPKCNKDISEAALFCPKCHFSLKTNHVICPDCKKLVSDQKSECPECGLPLKVETKISSTPNAELKLELIEYLMKQTENNDRKVDGYKKELDDTIGWWVAFFGTCACTFVAIVGWFGYHEYNDVKSEIVNFKNRTGQELTNEIEIFKKETGQELATEKEKIKNEIEKLMSTSEIKLMVKETAKKYSNEAIEEFIAKKIDEKLMPFINKASTEINLLSNHITVLRLSSEAYAGSFNSFKNLKKYAQNETGEIGKMAFIELENIKSKFNDFKKNDLQLVSFIAGTGEIYIDKLKLPDIIAYMHLEPQKIPLCIPYISAKEPQEVYKEAKTVFEKSNNLYVKAAFGSVVAELANKNAKLFIDPWDFESLLRYCQYKTNESKNYQMQPK